jgi:hypothetical protein
MRFQATLRTRHGLTAFVMSIGLGAGVCIPLGLMTAVTSLLKGTTVLSQRGMTHVSLGYPFHWVIQDQTMFSPPRFPVQASFESPHHSPTHVVLSGLVADSVVWALALWIALMALLAVTLLIRQAVRRSRGNLADRAESTYSPVNP